MCLDTVTSRRHERPGKPVTCSGVFVESELDGETVYLAVNDAEFGGDVRAGNRRHYLPGRDYSAAVAKVPGTRESFIPSVLTCESREHYPAGFHRFPHRRDAVAWRDEFVATYEFIADGDRSIIPIFVVLTCEVRDIICRGIQEGREVIVSSRMRIVEQEEQQ